MKIARPKLIRSIDAEIDRREAKADSDYNEALAKHEEMMKAYSAETRDAWKQFASLVSSLNFPVWDDVPDVLKNNGYRNMLRFWDAKDPVRSEPDLTELLRMRALVEAVSDDEISTSELTRIGFKFTHLFR